MIDLPALGVMAGGLGLFMLGMGLMTDGLKLAAGPALHRILSAATRTRAHALGSGMLVTALVQSSSAVTVAAIGFVNVGLLALARDALGLPPDPATKLALFHTTFSLLGVLPMWPLAARPTHWLKRRFRAARMRV